MPAKSRKFLKGKASGGRAIASAEALVEAVLQHFAYDKLEESPFPSQEPPPQAIRKWFDHHLRLKVLGPSRFEWTCPGCQARIQVETDYLHTCRMFDYEYWQFCPDCATILSNDN